MTIHPTSVIVCTYNRAALLPRVLNQLRAQDYPADAFEIIVVDNGSTDQTPQVVRGFIAEPGVPIHYVCESRQGITFARNRGAEEARYPYLAYIDDDCSVEPDWLSLLVGGFDLRDGVVAVGGLVVLDWSQSERPAWLGPGLERWLGSNGQLGAQSRLLDKEGFIMESNMGLKRDAWHASGGFLGMEQFGSQHMAAQEITYLLHQLRQRGGQIAFIPKAIAVHRMGIYTRRRFLRRGYWQGVSSGLLDYLINKRSWLSTASHLVLNTMAMVVFLGYTCFSFIKLDQAEGMYHLVRALRRFSLVVSGMHLAGDWPRVRSWGSTHNLAK
jgi:glycosyltransferase involved in cell wall biosynthesis